MSRTGRLVRVTLRVCTVASLIVTALADAHAQDALTIGSGSAATGTVAQIPIYARDVSGTSLGSDAGAGRRIQAFSFKVTCSPATAVTSMSFSRAGVLADAVPLYERSFPLGASLGYVASFAENGSAVPLVLDRPAPGDTIGTLSVALSPNASSGGTVTLAFDPSVTILSNQAGTVIETGGLLTLVSGSIAISATATSTSISSSANPSAINQPVTFTATVTSSASDPVTGSVTFRDGATTLGGVGLQNGTATFTTSALAQGTHSMTAVYGGSGSFDASTSLPLTQTVNALPFAAPAGVVATATTPTQVLVTWFGMTGVDHFEILRATSLSGGFALVGTSKSFNFIDNGVTPGRTYLYIVRAVNTSGAVSPNSAIDAATTIVFSDDPLSAGHTSIRATHIGELRTAVNLVRAAAGLTAAAFTNAATAGTPVRAADIAELRSALAGARSALSMPAIAFTDATLTPGATAIKAVHIQEVRDGVK